MIPKLDKIWLSENPYDGSIHWVYQKMSDSDIGYIHENKYKETVRLLVGRKIWVLTGGFN